MLIALSTPDTVVLVLVAFFALRGAFKGFVWQALRTGGLLAGLLLASRYGEAVGRYLSQRFSFVPASASDVVGWATVIVGTFVAVTMVAHLARNAVHQTRLTSVDRLFGAALGAALGLGIAAIVFTVAASWMSESARTDLLGGSASPTYMAQFVDVVTPLFPDGVRDRWGAVFHSLGR